VYVSSLRKALAGAAGALETRPGGYALLVAEDDLDVLRFERLALEGRRAAEEGDAARASSILQEALGLWRGPALPELRYEDFAQTEIERLEELRLGAIEQRIDADLALGRHAELAPELEALVGEERRTLALGAFPSALATVVPAAIVRLRERMPDVQVEAGEASGEELGAMVAAGTLHAAMCFQDAEQPPRRPEGTERHELGHEAMLAVMATDHPLAGRDRLTIADLADETWTAPSRDHLIYRACVAAGFEPRIAFVTRDVLAARGLVASGLAVTLMPELLAAGLPGVAMVPLEGPQPLRSLYGLTPAAGARPAALAFLEALERP
jgi:DNA-binding transcriptional LysR family regulator